MALGYKTNCVEKLGALALVATKLIIEYAKHLKHDNNLSKAISDVNSMPFLCFLVNLKFVMHCSIPRGLQFNLEHWSKPTVKREKIRTGMMRKKIVLFQWAFVGKTLQHIDW